MSTNDYINLYGVFRQLNSDISSKYKKDEASLKFYDFFLFHMTSLSCGILYELLQNSERLSSSELFFARSLIEDIAVLRMYDNGDVAENSEYLLKGFNFLCEYNLYKKYKNLDGKYFDFSQIKKNYQDYIKDFKRVCKEDFNELETKEILKNRNLAFLEINYNYLDLIDNYASEYKIEYNLLSMVCHISDIILSYEYINNSNNLKLIDRLLADVFNEVDKYYGTTLKISELNNFLNQSIAAGICDNNLNPYFEITVNEVQNMYLLVDEINTNFSKIYDDMYLPAVFFQKIADEIESLSYDLCYSFSDNAKCRIKPIYELVSTYHFINKHVSSKNDLFKLKIIQEYFKLNICKNYRKISKEEFESYGYNNFTYDEFKDISTKPLHKYLGYKSVNDMVYEMIDDFIIDTEQNSIYKLIYAESQYFSHGNGYSLISNEGAFKDINPCIDIIDNLLLCCIKEYSDKEAINISSGYQLHIDNYNMSLKTLGILKDIINNKKKVRDGLEKNKTEIQ